VHDIYFSQGQQQLHFLTSVFIWCMDEGAFFLKNGNRKIKTSSKFIQACFNCNNLSGYPSSKFLQACFNCNNLSGYQKNLLLKWIFIIRYFLYAYLESINYYKSSVFSFGCFPGVWMLIADVSEHCIGSIFKGRSMKSSLAFLWRWNRYSVPKRRLLALRRRGNSQKKTYFF
jgi:hypothetical protein